MARTRKVIYVRTGGDDSTGLGTIAYPFKTLARALRSVNHNLGKHSWVVDCTDLGVHDIKDGIEIGGFHDGGYVNDVASNDRYISLLRYESDINIVATPTVAYTFTEANVTSAVYDSSLDQTTITVTGATFTNYADTILRTPSTLAAVVSVAGNVIVVAGNVSVTGAVNIDLVWPSCTLQATAAASGERHGIRVDAGVSVTLYGIGIDSNSLLTYAVDSNARKLYMYACAINKDMRSRASSAVTLLGCRSSVAAELVHGVLNVQDLISVSNCYNINPDTYWEDLQQTPDQGQASASLTLSTYRDTPIKIYQFSATLDNELYFRYQMPHGWDPTTEIHFHLHGVPMGNGSGGADTIRFEGKYVWVKIGDEVPAVAGWSTIGGVTGYVNFVVGATDQYKHKIIPIFRTKPPASFNESGILLIYVKRAGANAADNFAATLGLLSADVHYQRRKQGTYPEFTS